MRFPVSTGVGRDRIVPLVDGPADDVAGLSRDRQGLSEVRVTRLKIQSDTVQGVAKGKCRR